MGKVKKRGDVTGTRKARKRTAKEAPNGAKCRAVSKKSVRARKDDKAPVVTFRVQPLDPLARCGPRTSVQALYRVDEMVDGKPRPHLVFLDRHGWYCEHGRNCPAVAHARRLDEKLARTNGRTPNGRMRA